MSEWPCSWIVTGPSIAVEPLEFGPIRWSLLPGVDQAIRRLNRSGYRAMRGD